MENKETGNRKKKFLKAVMIASAAGCIFTFAKAADTLSSYARERKVYSQAKKEIIRELPDSKEPGKKSYSIDFVQLETKGCPATSWIRIPDTKVDYPLVQGKDNKEYLDKDAYGNSSSAGAIFIDAYAPGDLSANATLIYGHNMKDGTMFHGLLDYRDFDYATGHRELNIYDRSGDVFHYTLICTLKTTNESEAVYGSHEKKSVEEIVEALLYEAEKVYSQPGPGRLLLLSTCIKGKDRYVCVFQQIENRGEKMEKEICVWK